MAKAVRLLIVDSQELARLGLLDLIRRARPEWQVVGEASDGTEALDAASTLRPNLAVVDLEIANPDGLTTVALLRSAAPGIRIVATSLYMALPVVRKVKRAGAAALIAKNEPAEQFIRAIENVTSSRNFFASAAAWRDLSQLGRDEQIPIRYLLSPREIDVLRLLSQGMTRKRVAQELGISVRTADGHRSGIFTRSSAKSLGQAVRMAVRDGVI